MLCITKGAFFPETLFKLTIKSDVCVIWISENTSTTYKEEKGMVGVWNESNMVHSPFLELVETTERERNKHRKMLSRKSEYVTWKPIWWGLLLHCCVPGLQSAQGFCLHMQQNEIMKPVYGQYHFSLNAETLIFLNVAAVCRTLADHYLSQYFSFWTHSLLAGKWVIFFTWKF